MHLVRFFTSLSMVPAMLLGLFGLAGCGKDANNTSSTATTASSLAPFVQGTPSPVAYVPGAFYSAIAYVDDTQRNRWLVADKFQGLISIDKTSQAAELLLPLTPDLDSTSTSNSNSNSNSNSTSVQASSQSSQAAPALYSLRDMVLDSTGDALFLLDTAGQQLLRLDLGNNQLSVWLTASQLAVGEAFAWGNPYKLRLDPQTGDLLLLDPTGHSLTDKKTFALYSVTQGGVSLVDATPQTAFTTGDLVVLDFLPKPTGGFWLSGFDISGDLPVQAVWELASADWTLKSLYSSFLVDDLLQATEYGTGLSLSDDGQTLFALHRGLNSLLRLPLGNNSSSQAAQLVSLTAGDYPIRLPLQVVSQDEDKVFLLDGHTSGLYDATIVQQIISSASSASSFSSISSAASVSLSSTQSSLTNSESSTSSSVAPVFITQNSLVFTGKPVTAKPTDKLAAIKHTSRVNESLWLTENNNPSNRIFTADLSTDPVSFGQALFTASLTGIKPSIYTLQTDESLADFITAPKPGLIYANAAGDLFIWASGFARAHATDTSLVETFLPAIYKRAAGSADFIPISTRQQDNETTLTPGLDLDSGVTDFWATDSAVFFVTTSQIGAYVPSLDSLQSLTAVLNTQLAPRSIRGALLDESKQRVLLVDNVQDALLAVTYREANDGSITPGDLVVLSGRAHSGPYLHAPSGLLLEDSGESVLTFDNNLNALIRIQLATGERTQLQSPTNYADSVSRLVMSTKPNHIILVENRLNRLIEVDLSTGEQQVLPAF